MTSSHQKRQRSDSDVDEDVCSICLEVFHKTDSVVKVPCCNNKFHTVCLKEYCKKTTNKANCPMCRKSIIAYCSEVNPIIDRATKDHALYDPSELNELLNDDNVKIGDTITLLTDNQLNTRKWIVKSDTENNKIAKLIYLGDLGELSDSDDEGTISGGKKQPTIRRHKQNTQTKHTKIKKKKANTKKSNRKKRHLKKRIRTNKK